MVIYPRERDSLHGVVGHFGLVLIERQNFLLSSRLSSSKLSDCRITLCEHNSEGCVQTSDFKLPLRHEQVPWL